MRLSTFSTDAASQLDVLGHDGDTLGVDGAQVGVFEETYKVGFASLLQGEDSGALETEISLEILSDFTDETLERQLADQKLSALLVTTDLTESDGTGPVTVRFLNASGGGCALAGGFGSQLLARGLSSGGFTGGLLRTCHCSRIEDLVEQIGRAHV